MAIDRNAYKSLTESVINAVNPIPQEEIAEDVDVLDEILADGVELFGAEGLEEILADFADTGEVSEELAYLLSGEYLEEEDEGVPQPPKKKSKKDNSGKYNPSKGDCMYEDLQTQARFDEYAKKITKAGARGGNAIRAKDYAERNSKKIYGKGGKVVSRKPGGKYHGVPKFEREIVAYNKAWFPGLNRHPGRMP